jgi:RNA polymerase sigma-70 factor (ECF subfamily)
MTPVHCGPVHSDKHPNSAIFNDLYRQYKSHVYRFSFYLTQNRHEADDLFQETWLRVVRYLSGTTKIQDYRKWIFAITANLHKDVLRKKKIRRMVLLSRLPDSELEKEEAPLLQHSNPALHMDESHRLDLSVALGKALILLPGRQRHIFVLKEIEGFKLEEISTMLTIPVGTVKSLLFRAVRRLRKELSAYSPDSIEKHGETS